MLTDRLTEFYNTQAVGIMGVSVSYGLDCTFTDTLRCRKIGFSNLQMDDVTTCPLKLMGLFEDFHDHEGCDMSGPFRDLFSEFQSGKIKKIH